MSISAMVWAWKQELQSTQKFILLALADHANDIDFTCWPSLTHLQKKTGYKRPTIWKSIDHLENIGAITRVGTHANGSTLYRVEIGKEITLGKKDTQVTTLPTLGNDVNGVGNQGNKLGNDVTPNHKNHHEPSINHKAGLDMHAWNTWVSYRKTIRKPLKQVSMPAAKKALAAYGSVQMAVVQQSIANGWQGIFDLKNANGRAKTNGRKTFEDYTREEIPALRVINGESENVE